MEKTVMAQKCRKGKGLDKKGQEKAQRRMEAKGRSHAKGKEGSISQSH
jgi:hypothetical protein